MRKESITYGRSTIDYSLEFDTRKTLGIKVHPDKSVRVVAPLDSKMETIREKVKSKAAWILKQQEFFLSFHPLTPPRTFVSGETHLYLGKQYKLKLRESKKSDVKLHGGQLEVFINDTTDKTKVQRMIKRWYKEKADQHFVELYQKHLTLTRSFEKKPTKLSYRWMDKRWGSCDAKGGIHLNLELIKAPKKCIEYVLIHELCHLVHHNHSKAFYDLLESHLPDWKKTKRKLEKMMV